MHRDKDSVSSQRSNLIASVLLGLLIAVAVFACAPDPVPSAPVVVQSAPTPLRLADPVRSTPEPQPSVAVVGSAKGHTYHRPDCEWALKINFSNLVRFEDVKEAEQKGYRLCGACKPR